MALTVLRTGPVSWQCGKRFCHRAPKLWQLPFRRNECTVSRLYRAQERRQGVGVPATRRLSGRRDRWNPCPARAYAFKNLPDRRKKCPGSPQERSGTVQRLAG